MSLSDASAQCGAGGGGCTCHPGRFQSSLKGVANLEVTLRVVVVSMHTS